MNHLNASTPERQAAVKGLAVVGFVALIGAGMWLAIYTSRYIPDIVGSIGAAAVSLSQIFVPADNGTPAGTPPAATTTPDGAATSTPTTTPATGGSTVPQPGKTTTTTVPIGGSATTTPGALFGLADLVVTIDATGYLAQASTESFVATSTVPAGFRPAVKFTIRNAGTNAALPWRFSASIPTQSSFVYSSPLQQVLMPGDSIQYILGFDQPKTGPDQAITVTANPEPGIAESNTANNRATAKVNVLAS